MIIAVALTVSKINRGQRLVGSGQNEIHYNWLKCTLGIYTLLNLNVYILNGLPWQRFALSNCF